MVRTFFQKFVSRRKEGVRESFKDIKRWFFTFQGGLTIICIIGLISLPYIINDDYYTLILIIVMIFAILAASWDFMAGYVGQVSFGHAMFFGVSGYYTGFMMEDPGLPWYLALIAGSIMATLFGLIIGIPCLRLKGPYLALGTQIISLILFNLFMMETLDPLLRGTTGISGLPSVTEDPMEMFFIMFFFMLITLIILIRIGKSKMGTIFKSIRDDEIGADASGINTTKYKLIAFMISGFFAGIAGGLYVVNLRTVGPGIFQPLYSFYPIIMTGIGGIGTITGGVIGSFFFWFISEWLRPTAEWALLLFAVFLILVMRFAERGLMKPAIERLKDAYDFLRRK